MQNLSKKGNNVERWEQKQRRQGKKYGSHILYKTLPSGKIIRPYSWSFAKRRRVATFWQ